MFCIGAPISPLSGAPVERAGQGTLGAPSDDADKPTGSAGPDRMNTLWVQMS